MSRACEEARGWVEAREGGRLGDEESAALDVHLAICGECQEHVALLDAIGATLRDAPLPPLDPALEAMLLSGRPAKRGSAAWAWPAAVAAALLAAWVMTGRTPEEPVEVVQDEVVEDVEVVTAEPVEGAVVEPPATDRTLAGAADGTALYVTGGAVVSESANDARGALFHLEEGTAVAVVGENAPGYRFQVETPAATVTATGTIFTVQRWSDGRERYRVLEGRVEVRARGEAKATPLTAGFELEPGGEVRRAEPAVMRADLGLAGWPSRSTEVYVGELGRRLDLEARGASAPAMRAAKKPKAGLDDLFRIARRHQLAGEIERAATVHEDILRAHGGDRGAWVSHVALGQMRLEAGRPGDSLKHFDRYLDLAPVGTLAEQARFGRVGAARALKQHSDVVRWATDYLDHHPGTVGGAEILRARADARQAKGESATASADYRAIIAEWPETSQATHARVALEGSPEAP